MAAIITDDFRRNSTTFLIDDIKDQNTGAQDSANNTATFEYFVGIGKSDKWANDALGNPEGNQNFSTPLPTGSVIESKEVIDNLIGAVAVKQTQAYHVIPRINWAAGLQYKRWNENDPTMFDVSSVGGQTYYPCYVVAGAAGNERIYVCLDNNSNSQYAANLSYIPATSQNEPTGGSSARAPVQTSDGYIWAYVADLNQSSNFNTDQFISISNEVLTGADASDASDKSGGIVYGFEIVSAGSGITSAGGNDANNFKLLLNDNNNSTNIAEIGLTVDTGGTNFSAKGVVMSSYNTIDQFVAQTKGSVRASIVPASGTTLATNGAYPIIRPLVSPINGFGYQPTADLPAFYAGLAVNYNGDVDGELTTNITYRQISLLRNPVRTDDDPSDPTGDGDYGEQEVYNALRKFTLTGSPDLSAINAGDIIVDSSDGLSTTPAKAFVDYVDDANDIVYFHQNESADINQQEFTDPSVSGSKIQIDGGSSIAYSAITTPEYTPYTGEVYFLENRKPIQRAASQEEEIKLVIQF